MSELSKLEQKLIIKKIDKETINIQILDNNILLSITGVFNANLIELEKLTQKENLIIFLVFLRQ